MWWIEGCKFIPKFGTRGRRVVTARSGSQWSLWLTSRFSLVQLKVKCTLVQAMRLCTGRTAHRGSRGIDLTIFDHGARRWGKSFTPRPLFASGKDLVPIVQEAGWAPGPVWTGAENLAPTGIRTPDRPARSQSLYRLSYPTHNRVSLNVWQKGSFLLLPRI